MPRLLPAHPPIVAIVTIVLAVVAVPAHALAQTAEESPVARDTAKLDLDEILARHAKAIGGEARLAEMKSRIDHWTVTLETPYVDGAGRGTLIVKTKKPDRFRTDVVLEFNDQRYTQIRAYDGKGAWQSMQGNPPVRLSGEPLVLMRVKALQAHGGDLLSVREQGGELELKDREEVEGVLCHVIEVRPKEGRDSTHYIDAKTFLVAKTVTTDGEQGIEADVETYPSDYRRVEGLLIPHELEVVKTFAANDQVQLFVLELQEMKWNPGLEDSEFRFPEDGAAPAPPSMPKADTPKRPDGKKGRWY